MADDQKTNRGGNEPQSYGSNAEWLTGKTGQTVERTPERASRHDEAFYEDRHQESRVDQGEGGRVNEVQRAESDTAGNAAAAQVVGTATRHHSSDADQRKSYFRDRDYK